MNTQAYQLQFHTPAFLGDAAQSARWRTPPIKALLRQWWRVVYAADHQFAVNVNEMRTEEGLLFGHAWLTNDVDSEGTPVSARRSEVRLRLDRWAAGMLKNWEPLERVTHPEVRVQVGSDLYMGYGPLKLESGAREPSLKGNAAIQANEQARLSLAFPERHASRIQKALWLMNQYGTLGGRSRNGWGSFSLRPDADQTALTADTVQPLRSWTDCLKLEWPHAIGTDEGGRPLIWQTEPHADWKAVMKTLAMIKIELRTKLFKFNSGKDAQQPEDRHWLSYPVTNHSVKLWGNNARLPNTLRFKVRKTAIGQCIGVIFHMPCLPVESFKPDKRRIEDVWRRVHGHLDETRSKPLTRIAA